MLRFIVGVILSRNSEQNEKIIPRRAEKKQKSEKAFEGVLVVVV
jgi:hypothetical protein